MSEIYIYSVLANAHTFVKYQERTKEIGAMIPSEIVTINGGAGVTNPQTGLVPKVVETIVTNEQLQILKEFTSYPQKVESGYLLDSTKRLTDAEALEKLKGIDPARPLDKEEAKKRAKVHSRGADVEIVTNKG